MFEFWVGTKVSWEVFTGVNFFIIVIYVYFFLSMNFDMFLLILFIFVYFFIDGVFMENYFIFIFVFRMMVFSLWLIILFWMIVVLFGRLRNFGFFWIFLDVICVEILNNFCLENFGNIVIWVVTFLYFLVWIVIRELVGGLEVFFLVGDMMFIRVLLSFFCCLFLSFSM